MVDRADEPVLRLSTIRPLVRYVDENQAVIETHVALRLPLPAPDEVVPPSQIDLIVEVRGTDGFSDEQHFRVPLRDYHAVIRTEVVEPDRWWPAGMGAQPLYALTVRLLDHGTPIDERSAVIGLTSVRRDHHGLLVNGQVCGINAVVPIDPADERRMLPVTGDSLLVIRGHYGPDVLYDAADRAGILLIQCVPIHPEGRPEIDITAQVQRLAPHPSLAGWFVGHMGVMTERISRSLRRLDPARSVFTDVPRRS